MNDDPFNEIGRGTTQGAKDRDGFVLEMSMRRPKALEEVNDIYTVVGMW